jgi:7-carboxy-7-deazaguanine synthase
MLRLRISEIFYSLQGESSSIGKPTLFIRLTGCPLRCVWCDTDYAFTGGNYWTLPDMLKKVHSYSPQHICITGGEPMAQKRPCLVLMKNLCDEQYSVSLETSGSLSLYEVDSRVSKIMDLKAPDSGECSKNLYKNIDYLTFNDEIKIVISSKEDYTWAKHQITHYQLSQKTNIILSPSFNQIDPRQLAEWIIHDNLPVRFQIQLHKIIWNDEKGH